MNCFGKQNIASIGNEIPEFLQRFVGCITKGGKFKNLNILFNRICLNKGISYSRPLIVQNFNFIANISKAADYAAKTEASTIQECAVTLLSYYLSNTINSGKMLNIISKAKKNIAHIWLNLMKAS